MLNLKKTSSNVNQNEIPNSNVLESVDINVFV